MDDGNMRRRRQPFQWKLKVISVRWTERMDRPRMCILEVEPVKRADELDMRNEEMDKRMSLRFLVWVTGKIVVPFNEM